jgi:hypothetical protein
MIEISDDMTKLGQVRVQALGHGAGKGTRQVSENERSQRPG